VKIAQTVINVENDFEISSTSYNVDTLSVICCHTIKQGHTCIAPSVWTQITVVMDKVLTEDHLLIKSLLQTRKVML